MVTFKSSAYWITRYMGKCISHDSHPTRLTRYIISNSQISCDVFSPVEATRVSGRDSLHFLRKSPSTGTDNNVGSTINLARRLVRTCYARTLREYRLIARSECHRSALIRNTHPIYHRRYKHPLPSSHPQCGVPTASLFCPPFLNSRTTVSSSSARPQTINKSR